MYIPWTLISNKGGCVDEVERNMAITRTIMSVIHTTDGVHIYTTEMWFLREIENERLSRNVVLKRNA